jgi:hypothetical protein
MQHAGDQAAWTKIGYAGSQEDADASHAGQRSRGVNRRGPVLVQGGELHPDERNKAMAYGNYQGTRRPAARHPVGEGAAAAAAAAVIWAAAAYLTGHQFEILAVLTGFCTGKAVMRGEPRPSAQLRTAGAALAVAGCAAGTLIALIAIVNGKGGVPLSVILAHFGVLARAYPGAVGWMGLLFWAAAAAAGAFPQRARRRPLWQRRAGRAPAPARADAGHPPTVPVPVWPAAPGRRPGQAPPLPPASAGYGTYQPGPAGPWDDGLAVPWQPGQHGYDA